MAEPFVKICGLRELEHARVAMDVGASALGFILAPGKRQVTPRVVSAIRDELGEGAPPIVGVTVNLTAHQLADAADQARLTWLQLSGDESPELGKDIPIPYIKAMRFPVGMSVDDAIRAVDAWLSSPNPPIHVIADGHDGRHYGGTGTRADWELVAQVAARYPILLAGGLTPQNVGEAIRCVRPVGVDVSSGVEVANRKQPQLIRSFVENARAAWASEERKT